jgi:hypothetical protein
MGILKPLARGASHPIQIERLPSGSFSLHRGGTVVASTLPSTFPQQKMLEIGKAVLAAFKGAEAIDLPLTDLHIHFSGMLVTARELRGGTLIFIQPVTLQLPSSLKPPAMHYKNLDEFVLHLENYIECWKQFNHYVALAREKKHTRDDEAQFLEVKSIIAQGLEAISASIEKGGPRKEEVHTLFANAPSLRHLAEVEEAMATVESQWHKVYLTLQSLLGQLKVQQNKADKGGGWSFFSKR